MNQTIHKYLSQIGRRGGQKSRRKLTTEAAKNMVHIREARRAYRRFYNQCFWSYDPQYQIKSNDIIWVAEQLMKNGNREAWQIGARLCH